MRRLNTGGGMKKDTWLRLIAIGAVVFSFTLSLAAQQGRGRGRIRGLVEDEDGNPIPDVKISAVFKETGLTFDTKSDKKGNWALGGLGSGQFMIIAELDGFTPAQKDLTVSQFSSNNPSVTLTLARIQIKDVESLSPETIAGLDIFESGNQLYAEENYSEAAAKFQEFLAQSPDSYRVYINIGNCYRKLEEFENAVAAYTVVLDKVQEETGSLSGSEIASSALTAIGETYMQQGDLDKANASLQKAMAIFPEDETLAFNIGEILFTQGNAASGVEYFNKAIEIKPEWGSPYRQKGYALLNLADYQGALASFQKFLELAPDDPRAPAVQALIPQLESMIKK